MNKFDMPKAVKDGLIAEGKAAFEAGQNYTPPYPDDNSHRGQRDWWLHGWWKAFYAQRDADAVEIEQWLSAETDLLDAACKAVAEFVVTRAHYDRNQPINDNRINGYEFNIPAPATLKNGWVKP